MQVIHGCPSDTRLVHDIKIKRQNRPEYPMIVAWILLTADGNTEEMKKLAENHNHL